MLEEGHERPIAVVAHHSRPPMISVEILMKSFARFRQMVVIPWPDEAFVGVDAIIFRAVPTSVGATTERQGIPSNVFEGHKSTPY